MSQLFCQVQVGLASTIEGRPLFLQTPQTTKVGLCTAVCLEGGEMKALPCPAGVSLRIARYVFWGAVLSSLAVSAQAQQSYNYTPDFTLTTGLQVNGAAAVVPNSAVPPLMVVRLSDHLRDTEDGSAWYTNPAGTAAPVTAAPLPMKAGFTTSFTFQFTNQTGIGYADGIAF